jgi:membrane-associated protease RseP (regulator of RpoE activity)
LGGVDVLAVLAACAAGLQQIVFNFGAVQDKISGPVAIVNVGAEVARTDTAGLYQFAALVNLNLAVRSGPML